MGISSSIGASLSRMKKLSPRINSFYLLLYSSIFDSSSLLWLSKRAAGFWFYSVGNFYPSSTSPQTSWRELSFTSSRLKIILESQMSSSE